MTAIDPQYGRRTVRWLALGMVGLFAAAVIYINPLAPEWNTPDQRAAAPATHSPGVHGGDGLTDKHDGYALSPVTLPDRRGTALRMAFRILGPDGRATTAYEPVLGQPLHLYVLREDLSFYQHLHPALAGDTWTAAVDVPDGGVYRLYAEFVPRARAGSGHSTVLGAPFVIAGDTSSAPLPPPAPSVKVAGYTVRRTEGAADGVAGRPGIIRFQVHDASSAPVTALEPYLGAYAHASVFESTTQSFTHLHPTMPASAHAATADGVLTFHTQFPQRGRYRLFLQFKAAGTVHLAAFTVVAA
ncbi:hypothetical protein [Micromonospora sp. CPCC 206061]|uniref:hypothetical protein n=1 Tax=Micromonospora sp. CPCC 206061 TaxID=3122410 RepID=UPI002FF0AA8B